MDNFTLYKIPRNKGNKRTGNVRTFTINPRNKESIKEKNTENLKIDSNFVMIFTLSGLLIASSFISVNLFNPYMLYVIKKVIRPVFKMNTLNNKPEKRTFKKPLIAKKRDVEIKNDINLSSIKKNFPIESDYSLPF